MKFLKNTISYIFVGIFAIVLLSSTANAQESSINSAQGLQISPALVDLNAMRGSTQEIHLKITNVTAADLRYSTAIDDFEAANESGSPRIIDNSQLPPTASIKTWVQTESSFTLASKESKDVIVTITVPTNAEPGGHYGVLSFSGAAPDLENSTGVGLSASAGALLLVRVDGDITEKANLEDFYTGQPNKDSKGQIIEYKQSSFFENSPIGFVVRIKNEGNIHIKPIGNIELKDMFGNVVKAIPINESGSANVLPNSIRKFTAEYESTWMIGKYTATITLGYGTNGQAASRTIDFWVVPYKIILVSLFILFTFIYALLRIIRSYNRRIFEKAKNEIEGKAKSHKKKID